MSSSPPSVVRASAMPEGTLEVPVVIVGGGSCGLTAAIGLREAGIDCVVLERDATPTGSTALSSGFIPAAQTRLQKSLGIDDTYELLIDDVINKAHGQAPRPLVQAYVHAVTEAIDVLEGKGLPFEIVDGFLYPGHSVLRMHTMPEKTGATFMTRLEQLAHHEGVDILTEALVAELWVDAQDRVLGVGYRRPDGQVEHLGVELVQGGRARRRREQGPERRGDIGARLHDAARPRVQVVALAVEQGVDHRRLLGRDVALRRVTHGGARRARQLLADRVPRDANGW